MQARTHPRGLVLALLLVVYILNFLDRQILGILAEPIKLDFQLTDTQLGALGGIAFALLYAVMGVPLAVLADRTSRSWVIAASLAVWSAFTALCGMATSFWQLFLFRLGVGVGEAGGVAPSYALVTDYYPPDQRARALSIYSMGIPLGLAGGAFLGGYIAHAVQWRTAFIVAGVAGLLVVPIFKFIVRDLPRPPVAERVPISAVFEIVLRKRSFWLMALASSASSLVGYGLAFWVPSIMMRSFGFDLLTTSQYLGSLVLIGGTLGVWAGGWLADRLGKTDRGSYAKVCAVAWLISAPLFAAGFLTSSPTLAWLFLLLPNGLNILWLGPVATAVQHLVPQPMRASASATFLLINNLIGLGLGSLVMGAMSDAMAGRFGEDALRYSAVAALSFYVLAAVLMLFAVRALRREWVDDDSTTAQGSIVARAA